MNAITDKAIQGNIYPMYYHEMVIDKTIYRVTSIFKGEFKLKDALEDLAVRRALREALATVQK